LHRASRLAFFLHWKPIFSKPALRYQRSHPWVFEVEKPQPPLLLLEEIRQPRRLGLVQQVERD
jgi:hypothetical protein